MPSGPTTAGDHARCDQPDAVACGRRRKTVGRFEAEHGAIGAEGWCRRRCRAAIASAKERRRSIRASTAPAHAIGQLRAAIRHRFQRIALGPQRLVFEAQLFPLYIGSDRYAGFRQSARATKATSKSARRPRVGPMHPDISLHRFGSGDAGSRGWLHFRSWGVIGLVRDSRFAQSNA